MIEVSAPGSFVLFGEHAVLAGEPAIGCAVNKRIHVSVMPRDDRTITIDSELGGYEATLDHLPDNSVHNYAISLLRRWRPSLIHGLDIKIVSEFSSTVGLGSSAALTVALAMAFRLLKDNRCSKDEILRESVAIIRDVQGRGSGLDLACSTYGGLIRYVAPALQVSQIHKDLPLTLFYSGYKTPTPTVLSHIAEISRKAPYLHEKLYRLMGECSRDAIRAIHNDDMDWLGWCMNYYHGLLDALGVCDKTLANMVYTLREQEEVQGVKISGSGLGDCLVVLGNPHSDVMASRRIPVEISPDGVRIEANTS